MQDAPSEAVLYAIINPADSLNYVRLTKTCAREVSFDEMLDDPDNFYFDHATVSIDINSPQGHPLKSFNLERVLMPDKNKGIFASSPNYAYALNEYLMPFLDAGYQVRIVVSTGESDHLVTAQQNYRKPPEILQPKGTTWTKLSFYSPDPAYVEWEDQFGFKQYELEIRINYSNHYRDSIEQTSTSCLYHIISRNVSDSKTIMSAKYKIEGDELLRVFNIKLTDNQDVNYRSFISIAFIIRCLNDEYCNYVESSPITSDRKGRPVTNVVGGLGLFSLMAVSQTVGFKLDNQTTDSLIDGRYTEHLRFQKW